MKAFTYSLVLALAFGFAGCVDLTVDNENNPNRQVALASPEDVEGLASNLLRDYFWASQDCEMAFLLSTMADEISSSWANWGMRDLSSEPRPVFNNSPAYSRASAAEAPWFRGYLAISNAIDVLQSDSDDRAEQVQLIFSLHYDDEWQKKFDLASGG